MGRYSPASRARAAGVLAAALLAAALFAPALQAPLGFRRSFWGVHGGDQLAMLALALGGAAFAALGWGRATAAVGLLACVHWAGMRWNFGGELARVGLGGVGRAGWGWPVLAAGALGLLVAGLALWRAMRPGPAPPPPPAESLTLERR